MMGWIDNSRKVDLFGKVYKRGGLVKDVRHSKESCPKCQNGKLVYCMAKA